MCPSRPVVIPSVNYLNLIVMATGDTPTKVVHIFFQTWRRNFVTVHLKISNKLEIPITLWNHRQVARWALSVSSILSILIEDISQINKLSEDIVKV